MKTHEEMNEQKYFQTFVNITLTFDMKLSVEGDKDEWDAKHQAEEILNDLIAGEEINVEYGLITDVDVEVDAEISKEEFDAAPGKPDLHLGSHFKLN